MLFRSGDFTSMFLIYIVTFAITGVLIYFTGKVDKDAKEAMDALK